MRSLSVLLLLFLPAWMSAARMTPPAVPAARPDTLLDVAPTVLDTIETSNPDVKVILYSDKTWSYYERPSARVNRDADLFRKNWVNFGTDPYGIALENLPEAVTLRLVDSDADFHCPFQGSVYYRGKFGMRRGRRHQGVDLPLHTGDSVFAAFPGRVRVSRMNRGYGNLVVIRHYNGLETFYGHLSARYVEDGDHVEAGDVIGTGGSTGRSSGPHLHFETRYEGYAFDPQWLIDFPKGELRHHTFILKRKYLSPYSSYEQDGEDEQFFLDEQTRDEAAYAAGAPAVSPSASAAAEAKGAAAQRAAREAAPSAPRPKPAAQYHTVRPGDTLSHIAIRYKTSVSALCRLNKIKTTSTLRLGQRIRVR